MIYRAKGFAPRPPRPGRHVMNRDEVALDTLAREELGLDPRTLAQPWTAAASSFLAFGLAPRSPSIPFLFGSGTAPTIVAAVLSVAALFAVGRGNVDLHGRHAGRAGLRMALIGPSSPRSRSASAALGGSGGLTPARRRECVVPCERSRTAERPHRLRVVTGR